MQNNIWKDFYITASSNRRHNVSKILRAKRETHKCSSSIRPSNAFLVMVLILLFCNTLESTDKCLCQTTLHISESDQQLIFTNKLTVSSASSNQQTCQLRPQWRGISHYYGCPWNKKIKKENHQNVSKLPTDAE